MAEEKYISPRETAEIAIRIANQGYLVIGERFGGDNLRAFSTAEGLIEWLSRELGAGPIVWSWTLPIWAGMVGVEEDDLLPMPDQGVDPTAYQVAQEYNARFLITRFADKVIEARVPKPPEEPKPKKAKKVKEEPVVGPPGKAQGGGQGGVVD